MLNDSTQHCKLQLSVRSSLNEIDLQAGTIAVNIKTGVGIANKVKVTLWHRLQYIYTNVRG